MYRKNRFLRIIPAVIAALLLAGMTGCSDDKTTTPEKARICRPQSTFIMDFGDSLTRASRAAWRWTPCPA